MQLLFVGVSRYWLDALVQVRNQDSNTLGLADVLCLSLDLLCDSPPFLEHYDSWLALGPSYPARHRVSESGFLQSHTLRYAASVTRLR